MCDPSATDAVVKGDAQAANAPASTLHSKVALGVSETNLKLVVAAKILGVGLPSGPAVIDVSGSAALAIAGTTAKAATHNTNEIRQANIARLEVRRPTISGDGDTIFPEPPGS